MSASIIQYIFPKKCCVCLSDCSTTRELFESISAKDGFNTKITTFKCSVPVCEQCQDKFGRINYGWLTWFVTVLIGAIVGGVVASTKPGSSIVNGAALGAVVFAILALFPSIFISIKYGHKTEPPAFLSKGNGKPLFRIREYQRLFDEVNGPDPGQLYRPDLVKKYAEIETLYNQAVLVEIFKAEISLYLRTAALEKVTDQVFLAEIAKNDRDGWVRQAAIYNLIDQSVLTEIAKNDRNEWVRQAAVNKIKRLATVGKV